LDAGRPGIAREAGDGFGARPDMIVRLRIGADARNPDEPVQVSAA
jgi:hypothetical protein